MPSLTLPPNARVLVTGGSGFIGTNLVGALRAEDVDVLNVDRRPPRDTESMALHSDVDIRDEAAMNAAFDRFAPTHVVHLAARTDLGGTNLGDYETNTKGMQILLRSVARASGQVERLLVASSRMVCRIGYQPTNDEDTCPSTPYGVSKVETERLVRAAGLEQTWAMFRPTSIWGPWFDVPYRDFFLSVARRRYVHPRGRHIHKSFGFVLNSVDQIRRLLTAPSGAIKARTFYLADDPPIEVREFADRVSAELGHQPVRSLPVPLLRVVARTGDSLERVGARVPLTSFRLDNLLAEMTHDLSPLQQVVGEPRYGLEASVPITVDWMRGQGLV